MNPAPSTAACIDTHMEGTGEEEETDTGDTPPPDISGRLLAGAFCECGPILACKTQRCACRKIVFHCSDFRCCGCANVPSPRSEAQDRNLDGGEGGSRKAARREVLAAAEWRAAPPSPEETFKSLQHADVITTTNTTGDKTDKMEDGEGPAGDLLGYVPAGEERWIREVYGDWVQSNDGAHLSGGVKNDQAWQSC